MTHLPKRSFGIVAVAYADRPKEHKERAILGEDTAMTPDEVLQAKNQEENRRKSEYKYARLGAESGRKTEVRCSCFQPLDMQFIIVTRFHKSWA